MQDSSLALFVALTEIMLGLGLGIFAAIVGHMCISTVRERIAAVRNWIAERDPRVIEFDFPR